MFFNSIFELGKDFQMFITGGNYEKYLIDVLNSSKIVFPGKYERVLVQNNGEGDYVCKETGAIYDAKLVISTEQCRKLCGEQNIEMFMDKLIGDINQFYICNFYDKSEQPKIVDLINKQLNKDSMQNKNVILFFTYPIGTPFSGSIISQLATDNLDLVFGRVKDKLKGRELYAIWPTFDAKLGLRSSNGEEEFVTNEEINKIFKWTATR